MIMVLASYEWVAVLIIIIVVMALAYLLWRSFCAEWKAHKDHRRPLVQDGTVAYGVIKRKIRLRL